MLLTDHEHVFLCRTQRDPLRGDVWASEAPSVVAAAAEAYLECWTAARP